MLQLSQPINYEESLVLLADDDAVTLQLLGTFMEKEGLKYLTCNNGSAALSLAKEKLPDLILLDVMMPHMDGFETCRLLKDNLETVDIPVIFLTSMADTFDKIKGFNAGAVDYITKPFANVEVFVGISTEIKLKQAMDKLNEYTKWLEKLLNKETEKENNFESAVHSN